MIDSIIVLIQHPSVSESISQSQSALLRPKTDPDSDPERDAEPIMIGLHIFMPLRVRHKGREGLPEISWMMENQVSCTVLPRGRRNSTPGKRIWGPRIHIFLEWAHLPGFRFAPPWAVFICASLQDAFIYSLRSGLRCFHCRLQLTTDYWLLYCSSPAASTSMASSILLLSSTQAIRALWIPSEPCM